MASRQRPHVRSVGRSGQALRSATLPSARLTAYRERWDGASVASSQPPAEHDQSERQQETKEGEPHPAARIEVRTRGPPFQRLDPARELRRERLRHALLLSLARARKGLGVAVGEPPEVVRVCRRIDHRELRVTEGIEPFRAELPPHTRLLAAAKGTGVVVE